MSARLAGGWRQWSAPWSAKWPAPWSATLSPLVVVVLTLSFGLAWLAPGSAEAHQQKAAVTRVLFNSNSGNLEVMHRFLLHDAEHALQQLFDPAADILGSETAREQFADYVVERFALLDVNGSTLPLQYVGQEIDGGFLWVYQEMALTAEQATAMTEMSVVHNALRDIWPEQNNLVNIEHGDSLQTLNFNGSIEWLRVSFE